MKHPTFLFINPPIYDVAAYDLWAKPLGLLTIAAILKNRGPGSILLTAWTGCTPRSIAKNRAITAAVIT